MIENSVLNKHIKNMAVLILSHMYPSEKCSTTGIFIHEQVKSLRKHGVDARVLLSEGVSLRDSEFNDGFWLHLKRILKKVIFLLQYQLSNWEIVDEVPVMRLPYLSICKWPFLNQMSHFWNAKRYFKAIKNQFNFQLIHAHTSLIDGNLALGLSRAFNTPYIITEHTGPFSVLIKGLFLKHQTKKAIKNANQLIAISPYMLNEIIKGINWQPEGKATLVPNLVDMNQFFIKDRKKLKDANHIKILWVGHFVPVKQVEQLLLAFKKLIVSKAQNEKISLNLVGGGDDESQMKKIAESLHLQEHVCFLGKATRAQLNDYYNQADFLVISSLTETFGLVAIEAMSCGLPILSTKCGGPEFTLQHEEVGILVGKSCEEIFQGMQEMIKRLAYFDKNKIRHHVKKNFSHEVVGKKIIQEYAALIKN
jgi:glycosyltransferase involved in cell wall biosynthesis